MVVEEGHRLCGIFVKVVVAEGVVDAVQSAPRCVGLFVLGISESGEERKVHRTVEFALLHAGDEGRVGDPCLADDVEVGIPRVQGMHEFLRCLSVGIGEGVYSYSVDMGIFNPPLCAVGEVFQQLRIAQVEVGHFSGESSLDGLPAVIVGGVRVNDGRKAVVCE